jgi:hypothetical protein
MAALALMTLITGLLIILLKKTIEKFIRNSLVGPTSQFRAKVNVACFEYISVSDVFSVWEIHYMEENHLLSDSSCDSHVVVCASPWRSPGQYFPGSNKAILHRICKIILL